MKKEGQLVRNAKGQFVKGQSGNSGGRPKGSKNRVTLLKVMAEERFREDTDEMVDQVLKLILKQALAGDKPSQKMIWDAHISRASHTEDKAGAAKQQITIKHMEVSKEGDIIDLDPIEDNDEQREQSGQEHRPVQTH